MTESLDDFIARLDEYYPGSKRKRRPPNPEMESRKAKALEDGAWDAKPTLKSLPNGKVVELFSAGAFAQALNRPLVTLRLWERRGYIPRAPYRLKSIMVAGDKKPGWRMYSRAMVESALESFRSRGLLEKARIEWNNHRDLSIELVENWTRIHREETAQ